MSDIQFASRSEIGARSANEDYLQHGTLEAGWYAVLSDGAGGHSDGAIAADLVVRMVAHELSVEFARPGEPVATLRQVVHVANDALNRRQQGLHGVQRMHATLVVLWIDKTRQQAVWSHVGDSRLYLLRKGRIAQITRDDSVVQTMLDAGLIDEMQARHHAQRNQLIAAMGAEEPIEPHLSEADFEINDGDAFLLCSDGWYDPLEAADIEETLAGAHSALDWLDRMHTIVQRRQRTNQDNYSAIAVWVGNPAEITRIGPPG
jgi:serine/threonine protein phosphatase PrpC